MRHLRQLPKKVKSTSADKIGAIAGGVVPVEDMFALKQFDVIAWVTEIWIGGRWRVHLIQPKGARVICLIRQLPGSEDADALLIVGLKSAF